jgi:exosome complex RNA-binding protein Rrp4
MIKTDSNYIRRMKNHIIEFFTDRSEFSIGSIIGTNGYIWIYSPSENQLQVNKNKDPIPAVIKSVSEDRRECMAVLRNVIACLQRD